MKIKQHLAHFLPKRKNRKLTPPIGKRLPEFWCQDNLYERPITSKNVYWAYLSFDEKIIYIHNTKCGSSTLKYKLFEAIKGYPYGINTEYPEQNIHFSTNAFARVEPPPVKQGFSFDTIKQACQDKNALLFTFVRHPYQRAISAYYSKIVDDGHHVYFSLRDELICHYGLDLSEPNNPQNFHYFLQYLYDQQTNKTLTDVHFLPQTSVLDFENTTFDFIGKIETFEQDQQTLFHKIEQKTGRTLYQTKTPAPRLNKSSKQDVPYKDFLGKKEKMILQNIYQKDFSLLGYQP